MEEDRKWIVWVEYKKLDGIRLTKIDPEAWLTLEPSDLKKIYAPPISHTD